MKVDFFGKHQTFSFKSAAGYCCRVLKLTDLDQAGIELVGKHEEGKSNRDVVGVAIQNVAELKSFPRGFGEVFPNLRYLQIIRCSISALKLEDFTDLGNLQGLWLNDNLITELPNGLFDCLRGLQHLSFHKNRLSHIGNNLLTPLKNLKQAIFTDNTCIDAAYNENPEELLILQEEIATKCAFPAVTYVDSDSLTVQNLLSRLTQLETEMSKLASEAKKVESLEKRVADLERMTPQMALFE